MQATRVARFRPRRHVSRDVYSKLPVNRKYPGCFDSSDAFVLSWLQIRNSLRDVQCHDTRLLHLFEPTALWKMSPTFTRRNTWLESAVTWYSPGERLESEGLTAFAPAQAMGAFLGPTLIHGD